MRLIIILVGWYLGLALSITQATDDQALLSTKHTNAVQLAQGANEASIARVAVCGMELRPVEVAARLSLEGEERVFCSQKCLRRFIAAPQSYSG